MNLQFTLHAVGVAVAHHPSMRFTADIQRAWTEGGPKTLLTRGLRRIVRPVLSVGTLVFAECDLLKPMPERRHVPGIIVRVATMEDIDRFADGDLFHERMKAGHRCFMGIEESTGKLTNYRWVTTSMTYIPELKRHWIFKPGEAYAYDLNTLPEFRRRGIDSYTRHYIYSYLRDTGHTKLYAYIHGDNSISLNAARALLTEIGRIRYIQLRGCEPMIISRSAGAMQLTLAPSEQALCLRAAQL